MPKVGIHPKVSSVKYTMSKGTMQIVSTYKKDSFLLDNDMFISVAWADDQSQHLNEKVGNVAKFKQKFGGFSIADSVNKKEASAASSNPEEKKEVKKSEKKPKAEEGAKEKAEESEGGSE